MQMIAGIERRKQAIGVLRVARNLSEVDDAVEVVARSNPLVHRLAVRLCAFSRMIVTGTDKRKDRRTVHHDAVRVSPRNDLFVRRDHPMDESLVLGRWNFGGAAAW